jgi:hypothetical protein
MDPELNLSFMNVDVCMSVPGLSSHVLSTAFSPYHSFCCPWALNPRLTRIKMHGGGKGEKERKKEKEEDDSLIDENPMSCDSV